MDGLHEDSNGIRASFFYKLRKLKAAIGKDRVLNTVQRQPKDARIGGGQAGHGTAEPIFAQHADDIHGADIYFATSRTHAVQHRTGLRRRLRQDSHVVGAALLQGHWKRKGPAAAAIERERITTVVLQRNSARQSGYHTAYREVFTGNDQIRDVRANTSRGEIRCAGLAGRLLINHNAIRAAR